LSAERILTSKLFFRNFSQVSTWPIRRVAPCSRHRIALLCDRSDLPFTYF